MMTKSPHIILFLGLAFLLMGCVSEPVPATLDGPGIQLTVRCDNPVLTKAVNENKDGEKAFNENLIKSVDFLFYPGASPDDNVDAVCHVRKVLDSDPMQPGQWEATFNLAIKKDIGARIFTEENGYQATVYALVNFDENFIDNLSQTSRSDLAESTRKVVTDFSQTEVDNIQPSLLMDGRAVISFDPNATPNVTGEIKVTRFAAKLTVALNFVDQVVLKHKEKEAPEVTDPDEIWSPVLQTARLYLVDGIKSVLVSETGEDPNPEYFSYKNSSRAYVKESGATYLSQETVTVGAEEKTYYHTWPMYSYPASWKNDEKPTPADYSSALSHEPPYFKLEMDWRREPQNDYSYDRRKYYYKIYLPFDKLQRNNWYGFYVDVSILGSETDEGKASLDPTCYLLDWQNKELAINKYATISKARYLSLDKTVWSIDNMDELSIPFLSSHNVSVVTASVKATRPYYGQITGTSGERVGDYNTKYHAWIRKKDNNNYYLDYVGQPSGSEAYEPANWVKNASASIELKHVLQNDFSKDGFDYSPYTIELDIVHSDLVDDPTSHTYQQYLRHITIVQYPAIYIDKLLNRDTEIIKKSDPNPYGYKDGEAPWLDKPWGYVYVNGGRFVRYDNRPKGTSPTDPFYKLTADNARREYQWQTVWYTGGSRDMFNIHVTVLTSDSNFVIGDPREDDVNNLNNESKYPNLYKYTVDGKNADEKEKNLRILEKIIDGSTQYFETSDGVYQRIGFNKAQALYGDNPRPLTWYYPTEKSTRTENMLAPSYRIASKFGGTEYGGSFFGDLPMTWAEYRCAGYQEDGFPAGRWRLPTRAEIGFIAQLSAKKVFEFLFGSGGTYWSANGAIKVNANGTVSNSTATTALLRCVYDSWYWDEVDGREGDPRQDDPTIFVWGDKER